MLSLKYYKRLQYLYDEYKIFVEKYGTPSLVEEQSDDGIHIDPTLAQQFDLIQLSKTDNLTTASLFDRLLEQYRDEEEKHCNSIVNYIVKLLKSRSRRYIKEK